MHLAWSVLGGPLTYMGAADASTIQTGLDMFGAQLVHLTWRMFGVGLLVHLGLLLPFAPWALSWFTRGARWGWLKFIGLLLTTQTLWISAAIVRSPTLFAHLYIDDGTGLVAALFVRLCSPLGVAGLVLVGGALLWLALRTRPRAVIAGSLALVALMVGALAHGETSSTEFVLPKGSVVLLVADSLRTDALTKEQMPQLSALAERLRATRVPVVVPPVARTAPAITALLTGKFPFESGVTTMFSNAGTFDQRDSVVSVFSKQGYCTAIVSEYPGEFMRKIEFGFEHVDAPLVRFEEIVLQTVLTRDPFTLATLSYSTLRDRHARSTRNLMMGLPTFANGHALRARLRDAVTQCHGRPVFAFVFADQPHFPYVQTWPHYLELDRSYRGPYLYAKDPMSAPRDETDRERVRALYWASLRASDENFAELLGALDRNGSLSSSTVIVTGDHGESLYGSLGILGHGDQLGELEGIAVPWLAFGDRREVFEHLPSPVQSLVLSAKLAELRGFSPPHPPPPPELISVETELWLANTPDVPRERVRYPELAELFFQGAGGHIELKPGYARAVEMAKHREWFFGGSRYVLTPLPDRVRLTRDGVESSVNELPAPVTDFLERARNAGRDIPLF